MVGQRNSAKRSFELGNFQLIRTHAQSFTLVTRVKDQLLLEC
jgi:hypothetical protein